MLVSLGLATLVLLLERVKTVLLCDGAARVTVPATLFPPLTLVGFNNTEATPFTTLVVALSLLLPGEGSFTLPLTLAVFVNVPVLVVCTVILRVTSSSSFKFPMRHVTVRVVAL